MSGAAVRMNDRKRNHALPATWPAMGIRRGGSSSTAGDCRPGTSALAAVPATTVTPRITPNAARVATGPANGASAATTTAERAEHV